MLEESLEGRRLPLELERPFKRLQRNFKKKFHKNNWYRPDPDSKSGSETLIITGFLWVGSVSILYTTHAGCLVIQESPWIGIGQDKYLQSLCCNTIGH
jgi:hypothetical protein